MTSPLPAATLTPSAAEVHLSADLGAAEPRLADRRIADEVSCLRDSGLTGFLSDFFRFQAEAAAYLRYDFPDLQTSRKFRFQFPPYPQVLHEFAASQYPLVV